MIVTNHRAMSHDDETSAWWGSYVDRLSPVEAAKLKNESDMRTSMQWAVECLNGVISVRGPEFDRVIDCTDPLNDEQLVEFHRTFTGPATVATRVEGFASQYRRLLVSSPQWHSIAERHSKKESNGAQG
jgi:hypothetical protein